MSACFNTSHVTLYQYPNSESELVEFRFNTSHVTLYRNKPGIHPDSILVSIHLMLLFIMFEWVHCNYKRKFQYISCYSLSQENQENLSKQISFQYISCYSLSSLRALARIIGSFNTSHVTLYLAEWLCLNKHLISFNTSHVTLYHLPSS